MNENTIPTTNGASVITSVSQSSYRSDIIDLTDINDSDECEVTSSCSVIVSNNSVNPQQSESNHARNRRRKNSYSSEDVPSSKAWSKSKDDSICILYEKIQPPPDIEFVSEVIIDNSRENESANNRSFSLPIPPIIMGSYSESSDTEFQQIPGILNERTSSSSRSNDSSFDSPIRDHQQAPHHSSLPSCKYVTRYITGSPSLSSVTQHTVSHQRNPPPTAEIPLHSKAVSDNPPSHGSVLENPNIDDKVPKIQCGICLDGPDEIAASGRNFTSTKCGHVFCDVCIKTALKTAAKCPKCRKRVTSKQIHPLYL